MKKILRSSRRVRMGSRRSRLVTLFLLCSSLFLLSVTADDYVESTDLLPDQLLDIFGLIRIPIKDPVISFLLSFPVINPGLTYPNSAHLLPINPAITSNIILSTVIRI